MYWGGEVLPQRNVGSGEHQNRDSKKECALTLKEHKGEAKIEGTRDRRGALAQGKNKVPRWGRGDESTMSISHRNQKKKKKKHKKKKKKPEKTVKTGGARNSAAQYGGRRFQDGEQINIVTTTLPEKGAKGNYY